MEELLYYHSVDLPDWIKCQVLSFLRVCWPEGFTGSNRLRKWISPESDHPMHVVIVDDGVLISHAEVKWKYLSHCGELYQVYGLSGVFTYPAFRHHGYGKQVVQAGTQYILSTDADIGLFHCARELRDFYSAVGWMAMENVVTLYGDATSQKTSDELAMMMFLSAKGKYGCHAFEHDPIYFGPATW